VVERLAAHLRRLDHDPQVFLDAVLADVLIELTRAQTRLKHAIFRALRAAD